MDLGTLPLTPLVSLIAGVLILSELGVAIAPILGGAGVVGLAIARELAERMNGKVDVDTRPGRTAFALSLPAVAVLPDAVPVAG